MPGVQESVSGEMNVAVVGQFIAGRGSLVGGEIQGAEPLIGGNAREYRLSLFASEGKPLQSAADIAQTQVPRRSVQIALKRRWVCSIPRGDGPPDSPRSFGCFESLVSAFEDRIGQHGDGLRRAVAPAQFIPQHRKRGS